MSDCSDIILCVCHFCVYDIMDDTPPYEIIDQMAHKTAFRLCLKIYAPSIKRPECTQMRYCRTKSRKNFWGGAVLLPHTTPPLWRGIPCLQTPRPSEPSVRRVSDSAFSFLFIHDSNTGPPILPAVFFQFRLEERWGMDVQIRQRINR